MHRTAHVCVYVSQVQAVLACVENAYRTRVWSECQHTWAWSSHAALIVPTHLPEVGGEEDVVVMGTIAVTGAGLDEHHLAPEAVALGAAEFHLAGDCVLGRAAAAVRARTAEPRLVGPHAGTARQLEAHGLLGFWAPLTPLPLLRAETYGHVCTDILQNTWSLTHRKAPF